LSFGCGTAQLTPAIQILIAICCFFGGMAAFTISYYLYTGAPRGAGQTPEQQELSTTRSPAEILHGLSPNLTAVDKTSVGCGDTCAICLSELREVVDCSRHGGESSPATTHPAADARSRNSDARTAPPPRRNRYAMRIPKRRAATPRPTGDPIADGPELQALPCGHCFHGQCIRAWIVHRGSANLNCSCPLCKRDLQVVPEAAPASEEQAEHV
jgi:hypothetical protein